MILSLYMNLYYSTTLTQQTSLEVWDATDGVLKKTLAYFDHLN